MDYLFEPRVRRLVAEHLGVGFDALNGGDAGFRQVQRQFAWLSGRGVAVDVHRDRGHRVNQAA